MLSSNRLILASASPRRVELLSRLGVKFEVIPARVTEFEDPTADPKYMVTHNASLKADWVANLYPDALVLGADTTVFIDGTVLNKPANLADSKRMLRKLSGKTHTVYTGIAMRRIRDSLTLNEGISSEVTFKALTDEEIDSYVLKVNTLDKAGAYSIQDHTDMIIECYSGSFTNIMGLPVEETKQILTRCGHSL
jgi:septum formation protein